MDLALELGMTEGALRRSMTENELRSWQVYAAKRMLPTRRMEMLLAQIAQIVHASVGGAKDRSLADYLFDPVETIGDQGDLEPDLDDLAEFFGAEIVRVDKD